MKYTAEMFKKSTGSSMNAPEVLNLEGALARLNTIKQVRLAIYLLETDHLRFKELNDGIFQIFQQVLKLLDDTIGHALLGDTSNASKCVCEAANLCDTYLGGRGANYPAKLVIY